MPEPDGFKFDKSVVRMAFDAALAIVVAAVGFMVNGVYTELRDMQSVDAQHTAAIAIMRERLPIEYVRMDMYLRDRQEMLQILQRIDANVRDHRERTLTNGFSGTHK